MKLYNGGFIVSEGNPKRDNFLFNCTRNKACQRSYYVPIGAFDNTLQFYADLPFGFPDAVQISLIDECGEFITEVLSNKNVTGQKPNGAVYTVLGELTPVDSIAAVKCFYLEFIFSANGNEYIYWSEQMCFEPCDPLTLLKGCYPNENFGADAEDCNGIYYGYPDPATFIGVGNYRYFHWAWVRMGSVTEQKNKLSFTIFNSRKAYKNIFEREYIFECELVPTFYKNVLIGIFNRGNIRINGSEWRLADSQEISMIDNDSKLWKADILLAEECKQYFGCAEETCDVTVCCDPTGVTATTTPFVCCDPSNVVGVEEEAEIPPALRLLFDDIANTPVADPFSVDDWNTFFDTGANASMPFSEVIVVDNEIFLIGATNLTIKESLFEIGKFEGTDHLLKVIDELDCVVAINQTAFAVCQSLTDAYFPAVEAVEYSAFYACNSLVNVYFPLLIHASDYSFLGIGIIELTEVEFASLETTGNAAFDGCTSLAYIHLPLLTSTAGNTFGNGSLITSITDANLPSLTYLGGGDFESCLLLTEVSLSGITTLNGGEFSYCTSLPSANVYLPNVVQVGVGSFNGCNLITYADHTMFPAVTYLHVDAFQNCQNLTTVDFANVTAIGRGCFSDCYSLNFINLPLCATLGDSVDVEPIIRVFLNISGNTIDATFPTSVSTANAGGMEEDIAYLQANNTVSLTLV